jgi:hypothetical protein
MVFCLGSWADGGTGGSQTWAWDEPNGVWGQIGGNNPVVLTPFSITISATLASLGLAPGNTFNFDVYSSGGGADPASDALANPNPSASTWSDTYESGSLVVQYTVANIPEPTTAALFGLAGLVAMQRVLRRRK